MDCGSVNGGVCMSVTVSVIGLHVCAVEVEVCAVEVRARIFY